ncbi:DUF2330 domain-containing protein [Plesiocystis pacifica]|uniref:DUF2330 domain-containing protein n=1 Tax=Plesiocystis pacifica TaxID=191768 RepID=UPI0005D47549|nr:DUF2330 domain-containing protein [Plesiocystis pacifica]
MPAPLSRPRWPALVGASLIVLGALALPAGPLEPGQARACGTFRGRGVDPERTPTPSREKVLLIHDAEAGREHFVREIAFRHGSEPFGFVVPTPSRPEVVGMEGTPFGLLRRTFPFAPTPRAQQGAFGYGAGPQSGVDVLDVEKVGSFTAFVLAASDSGALGDWLEDNDFASTPETRAWLEHYVRMGFYYVALRYEPPPLPAQPDGGGEAEKKSKPAAGGGKGGKKGSKTSSLADRQRQQAERGKLASEVLRISFDTPVPYYPYFEPTLPAVAQVANAAQQRDASVRARLLELWVVGQRPVVPVATARVDGETRWVRPLAEGQRANDGRARFEQSLGRAQVDVAKLVDLLPAGELVVQTFQDQKSGREGYGDILFAPAELSPLDEDARAALEPLLGVLDPALVPPPPKPKPKPKPDVLRDDTGKRVGP